MNYKAIAITVGAVLLFCGATTATGLIAQEISYNLNHKSMVGTYLLYEINGDYIDNTNNDTYSIVGLMSQEYLDYDSKHGYQTKTEMAMTIDAGTFSRTTAESETKWSDEDDGNNHEYKKTGDTVLSTDFGEKKCEIWEFNDNGDWGIEYVGNDNIIYLAEGTSAEEKSTMNFSYKLVSINEKDKVKLTREYSWSYKGQQYSTTLDIALSDFVKYRTDSIVRSQVTNDNGKHDRSLVTYDDKYVKELASAISTKAAGMNSADRIGMVLAFTQYIEYCYDEISMGEDEYWKYPVETLVDMNGDCEDTSILFCAIAKQLGYDTCMILYPGHMAAGVNLTGLSGYYYTFETKHYYYCETTATGWDIGDDPGTDYDEYHVDRHIVV